MKQKILLFLTVLSLLAAPGLIIICSTFWLIQRLTPDQLFALARSAPISLDEIGNLWKQNGLGITGIHYMVEELFGPVLLPIVLLQMFALILLYLLIRLAKKRDTSLKAQIRQEEFDGKSSISRLLANKWIQKERRISMVQDQRIEERHQYENTLHELRSKLMSLYFLADGNENAEEISAVLHTTDSLIVKALQQSVLSACSLKKLTEDVLSAKFDLLALKDIQIESSLKDVQFLCDGLWLSQVLETALNNALENTPAGSVIQIMTDFEPQSRLAIVTIINPMDSEAEKTEEADQKRYQKKSSTHFGIGLSMAQEVMKRHHGKLEIHKEDNIFLLTLKIPVSELEERNFL